MRLCFSQEEWGRVRAVAEVAAAGPTRYALHCIRISPLAGGNWLEVAATDGKIMLLAEVWSVESPGFGDAAELLIPKSDVLAVDSRAGLRSLVIVTEALIDNEATGTSRRFSPPEKKFPPCQDLLASARKEERRTSQTFMPEVIAKLFTACEGAGKPDQSGNVLVTLELSLPHAPAIVTFGGGMGAIMGCGMALVEPYFKEPRNEPGGGL